MVTNYWSIILTIGSIIQLTIGDVTTDWIVWVLGIICFVCAHVCADAGCDGLNMFGPWGVALLGVALSVEVCHCVRGLGGLLVLKL